MDHTISEYFVVKRPFQRYLCRYCPSEIRTGEGTAGMRALFSHLLHKHRRELEAAIERERRVNTRAAGA